MKNFKYDSDRLKKLITDEKLFGKVEKFINEQFQSLENQYRCSFEKIIFVSADLYTKITRFSESTKKITGYSDEEIQSLPGKLTTIIHEEDKNKIVADMNNFFSKDNNNSLKLIYRVISKDNEEIWLNENIYVKRNKSGKVTAYESIIFDVTDLINERKDLDEKNEELIELNKIKDTFISIVSHDLKAPYTSLLGFSQILLNEKNLSENDKTEYLSYINDASEVQLNLINHLLDWSRLQIGTTKVEHSRLNLKSLISTVVSQHTGITVRKNIDIQQNIPTDLLISADERLLSKAVADLLSNAIKFSNENSSVQIYGNKFKNEMIEITVKDRGIGIKDEDHDKLFRLDKKFSKQGTQNEPGSGMGLNLVKEIISKHNGEVWFYSKAGEGSEFHITVPEAKNIIFIILPDEKLIEKFENEISPNVNGFEIITTADGFEAMKDIMGELPALIITSHDIPLLSGIHLVKSVRDKDKYYTVPIFVVVEKINEEIERQYVDYAVDEFISKSIESKELISLLNKYLK